MNGAARKETQKETYDGMKTRYYFDVVLMCRDLRAKHLRHDLPTRFSRERLFTVWQNENCQ